MTRTCLYRLFGESDELLYVGISKSPLLRLGQHLGEGRAKYLCERGHAWTCCWGHRGSGTSDLPAVEMGDEFSGLRPVLPGDDRLTPDEVAEIRRILDTRNHYGPVLICRHEQVKNHLDGSRKCRDCGEWIGHPTQRPVGGRG